MTHATKSGLTLFSRQTAHVHAVNSKAYLGYKAVFDENVNVSVRHFHEVQVIVAFSERAEEFRKSDCEVLAASTDSHFIHLAWINTENKQGGLGPMKIPLLADPTQAISRDYGVLKEDEGIAYRGLFVIGDKDILRQIPINDLPEACSVDETLCLVQAFQHTDKFGEVCPAGRRPGRDTIVPDIQKSKEFFSKQK
ncbi:peroxiredoxin-like [Oncorhynchus mykiss]|uniref:peroxiredoxin-like n=1 Tax=Oncorhynchus mykiss TaxID=8022 RepID=UPI00187771E0|nr:peroxiredoxin-like [Oncorhynchus mykiss]